MAYTVILRGNKYLAARWLGFAKTQARRLRAELGARNAPYEGHQGQVLPVVPVIGQRVFRPKAGIEIQVRTVNDNQTIMIRAGGRATLYMESGVLDGLGIAPLDVFAYVAGELYYGEGLEAYRIAEPDTALLGRAWTDTLLILRGEARAPGQSDVLNLPEDERVSILTVSDEFGNTETFGDPDGPAIYLPPPRPYEQRRAQSRLKPSLWGGNLLGAHIQALYGSQRSDYTIIEIPGGRWFLRLTAPEDNPNLDWIHNFSNWIYVDENLNFFLMTIRFHRGYVRPMSLTGTGPAIRARLLSSPPPDSDHLRRIWGYMLSTLVADDFETPVDFIRLADPANSPPGGQGTERFEEDGLLDIGIPPAYGWKFNYEGTNGYITTIRESPDHNTVPNDYAYESRLFECIVQDNGAIVEDLHERFQFEIILREGPVEFFPRIHGGDNVWRPSTVSTSMTFMGLNLDPDIPVWNMDEAEAPLYVWWAYTNPGQQKLHTLYYNCKVRNELPYEDGDVPWNTNINRSCLGDPPPAVYTGNWTARRAFGNHAFVTFAVKVNNAPVREYRSDERNGAGGDFVDYQFTRIERDGNGSASGGFIDWTVDDTKTLCNQGEDTPVQLAQQRCLHPETGAIPSNWYAREKRGYAARYRHDVSTNTVSVQIAPCIPHDNAAGLYVAYQSLFDATITYNNAINQNHIIGWEVMGAWDGTAANPGPLSLATLNDFLDSFVGFGTTKHRPWENVNAEGNVYTGTFTGEIQHVRVDYFGPSPEQGGRWEYIYESYIETGIPADTGENQHWPDPPGTGPGSGVPPRRPGAPSEGSDGWGDFLAVVGIVDPITVIPSYLYARQSAGRFLRDAYETPPAVGTGKEIFDDGYDAFEDITIHRTFVGHQ